MYWYHVSGVKALWFELPLEQKAFDVKVFCVNVFCVRVFLCKCRVV